MAFNIVMGMANGGIKGGLLAAFGSQIPGFDHLATNIAVGVLYGGFSTVVMGGKFKEGVVGSLKSAAIGLVMGAIAQGVKSKQTGGKFKNGSDALNRDSQSQTFPEPTTALDNNVTYNPQAGKKIMGLCSPGRDQISGELVVAFDDTVSRDYANAYIEQANASYSTLGELGSDGIVYSAKIRFIAVFQGEAGYITADIQATIGTTAEAQRGGRLVWVLGGDPAQILNGQAAHEFSHILGLGHQLNATNSITSYKFDSRYVTWRDIKRLAEKY
jgi:hypothetical protein